MGSNPSFFNGLRRKPANPPIDRTTLPVEQVSWDDIQDFESATGLELPTEAQWEYACRAGTVGRYAGTGDLDDMGWFRGNSHSTTHSVGQKQGNQFGLHDMHGNVREWCEDVYKSYSGDVPSLDPLSTTDSEGRVFRGGCWGNTAMACRTPDREREGPTRRDRFLGFRPAAPKP